MTRWTGDMARMEDYTNACRVFSREILMEEVAIN
jgi:hypothetical protein